MLKICINYNLIKMGCISSKVVSRSLSIREELNQSLHRRRANGISKSSTSSHFLALVSSANLAPDEIPSSLEQEEKKQVQPASPVLSKVAESIEVDLGRRSKSFHWFDDYEVSSLAPGSFDGIKEYKSMQTNGGRKRARSFHTVQEFDAMVEKMCFSRAGRTGFGVNEDSSLQLRHSKSSTDLPEHAAHKLHQEVKQSRVEESTMIEDMGTLSSSGPKPEKVIPSVDGSGTREETTQKGDIPVKGLKRKAIANELQLLRIPPSIEFPGVVDLRERLHAGGQVYSPGTYVTPKFGSYNLTKSGFANKCSEGSVFDPELVAALEGCMEQLEVEEENILKQIKDNFKEKNIQKKYYDEEIASHRNNKVRI